MINLEFGTSTQDENTLEKSYPPITYTDAVTGESKTVRFGEEEYIEHLHGYNARKVTQEEEWVLQEIYSLSKESTHEEKHEPREEKNNGDKVAKKQKSLGAKKIPRELTEVEWKRAKRRWIDIMDGDMLALVVHDCDSERCVQDIQFVDRVGIRVQIVADILRIPLEDILKLIKKAEKKTKKSILLKNNKKYKLENKTKFELSKEQIKNEFNKKDGYISFPGIFIFMGWFFTR